jgi:hypothetical protein
MRWRVPVTLVVSMLFALSTTTTGTGISSHGASHRATAKSSGSAKSARAKGSKKKTHRTTSRAGVTRTANGHIARSPAAKHAFEVQTGYPHGRPGYVVDHIVPLACGGLDVPGNMQWQTIAAAKAKDTTERIGCR